MCPAGSAFRDTYRLPCVCVSRARYVSAELHPLDRERSIYRRDIVDQSGPRKENVETSRARDLARGLPLYFYMLSTQHMRFVICTPEGPHTHARTPPKAGRSSQRHGHVSSQCSIEDGDNGLDRIGADSLVEAGVVKFHGEVSCRGVVQRGSLTGLRVADAISMRTSHARSLF